MSHDLLVEAIGWTSSVVLFLTIVAQIRKQWRARRTDAVSPWLFVGQLAASAGFVTYSALIDSDVFVVTNAVLGLTALAGLLVLRAKPTPAASAPTAR